LRASHGWGRSSLASPAESQVGLRSLPPRAGRRTFATHSVTNGVYALNRALRCRLRPPMRWFGCASSEARPATLESRKRRGRPKSTSARGGQPIFGLYKADVIRRKGPWRTLEDGELATLEWVDWFKHRRLFGPIGNIPPGRVRSPVRWDPSGPGNGDRTQVTDSPENPGRFGPTACGRSAETHVHIRLGRSLGKAAPPNP
jgi:hypothetical protein